MPLPIAVLASGNGSNFQAIQDAIESHLIPVKIVKLISDNPGAYVLSRAQKHKIQTSVYERKSFPNKESFEKAIVEDLKKSKAEWVLLAGYMRIVSSILLDAFPNKILNIHPSLLPSFPGLNAIQQAFDSGVKTTGCTVHFVDEGCDTGPIIAQTRLEIRPQETLDSLTQRMHEQEHLLYVQVLQWICEGKIKVSERQGLVS